MNDDLPAGLPAPDQMRGRMQGVFTVVVAGGPRIADLVHGLRDADVVACDGEPDDVGHPVPVRAQRQVRRAAPAQ
mgnify:CR=1 FL=1